MATRLPSDHAEPGHVITRRHHRHGGRPKYRVHQPWRRPKKHVPKITKRNKGPAHTVVLNDDWEAQQWLCHECGHELPARPYHCGDFCDQTCLLRHKLAPVYRSSVAVDLVAMEPSASDALLEASRSWSRVVLRATCLTRNVAGIIERFLCDQQCPLSTGRVLRPRHVTSTSFLSQPADTLDVSTIMALDEDGCRARRRLRVAPPCPICRYDDARTVFAQIYCGTGWQAREAHDTLNMCHNFGCRCCDVDLMIEDSDDDRDGCLSDVLSFYEAEFLPGDDEDD